MLLDSAQSVLMQAVLSTTSRLFRTPQHKGAQVSHLDCVCSFIFRWIQQLHLSNPVVSLYPPGFRAQRAAKLLSKAETVRLSINEKESTLAITLFVEIIFSLPL